jgi:hypothetical protein
MGVYYSFDPNDGRSLDSGSCREIELDRAGTPMDKHTFSGMSNIEQRIFKLWN